jgi:hypothetical protein
MSSASTQSVKFVGFGSAFVSRTRDARRFAQRIDVTARVTIGKRAMGTGPKPIPQNQPRLPDFVR